jgi:hypothetical protein
MLSKPIASDIGKNVRPIIAFITKRRLIFLFQTDIVDLK